MIPIPAMLFFSSQLTHLAPVDIVILGLYFVLVIFIGFYVKGSTNTSEEFFLAGREMSPPGSPASASSQPTSVPSN